MTIQEQLTQLKQFRPFAQCFAANVDGEWATYAHYTNMMKDLRKARFISVEILSAQKLEAYQKRGLKKVLGVN